MAQERDNNILVVQVLILAFRDSFPTFFIENSKLSADFQETQDGTRKKQVHFGGD